MTIDNVVQQIKQRPRKPNSALTVDDVKNAYRIEHREALEVLKTLAKEGLGRFVVGRGSSGQFKTRIEWLESPISIAIQSKATFKSEELLEETSNRDLINRSFPLNGKLEIVLSLPRNLTTSEAERISKFVMSLAIED